MSKVGQTGWTNTPASLGGQTLLHPKLFPARFQPSEPSRQERTSKRRAMTQRLVDWTVNQGVTYSQRREDKKKTVESMSLCDHPVHSMYYTSVTLEWPCLPERGGVGPNVR